MSNISDLDESTTAKGRHCPTVESPTTESETLSRTTFNGDGDSSSSRNHTPSGETDFEFIRSPSKRKYFSDNLVQNYKHPTMTLSFQQGGVGDGDGSQEKREISFVPPEPVISYTHGLQQKPNLGQNDGIAVPANKESRLEATFINDDPELIYQPTTTPIYINTKLQFSSIEKFIGSTSSSSGGDPEKGRDPTPEYKIQYLPDDNVHEALLAFLFSSFNLVFCVGIGYWHLKDGNNDAGHQTFIILIVSGLIMKLAFLLNRDIKVWRECKPIFLLCLVPFFTAFALSFADLIFTVKVSKNKSYLRPWTNTRMVYFVESLVLTFPLCVYQSVVLVEDPNSIPSAKGMVILIGLNVLVLSMAFARIRYDSVDKPNRFGTGLDKLLRSVILGSSKGLWVVTYVCAIITSRLQFPNSQTMSVLGAVAILLLAFEIPMLISTIKVCGPCVMRFQWVYFMIPQFVFLVVLIYWVNLDPGLYETNVGVCLLGAASMFESIVLMGWLLDSCNDREPDTMPMYPHFLGDFWTCGERRKQPRSEMH